MIRRIPTAMLAGSCVGLLLLAIITIWLIAEGTSAWAIVVIVLAFPPLIVASSYISWKLTTSYIHKKSQDDDVRL